MVATLVLSEFVIGYASANGMTTLMSSDLLSSALAKSRGCSHRVIILRSQVRSACARTSPALYQCRLFALTLPKTTLFLSTASDATLAVGFVGSLPPCPTPV